MCCVSGVCVVRVIVWYLFVVYCLLWCCVAFVVCGVLLLVYTVCGEWYLLRDVVCVVLCTPHILRSVLNIDSVPYELFCGIQIFAMNFYSFSKFLFCQIDVDTVVVREILKND